MPNIPGGYQPDTKSPSSRRADFDLLRRITTLERDSGGGPGGGSGTLILDGNGPPANSLGALGNYYTDKTNGVLYGPKQDPKVVTGTVLTEPFNNFTYAPWTLNGTPTIVAGRNGTAAQIIGTAYTQYTIPAPSQTDTLTVGFAFRYTDALLTTSRDIFRLFSGGTTHQNTLRLDPNTNTLTFCNGPSAIIVSSPPGVVAANTWAFIEVQVKLSDTVGTVALRINDVLVANVINVDTQAAATPGTPYTTFRLCPFIASTTHQYDDLYLKTVIGAIFEGDFIAGTVPIWPVTVRRLLT